MSYLLSLPICLGLFVNLASQSPGAPQPQPGLRVFADFEHTGILAGPLISDSPDLKRFGIAVPLPVRRGGRDRGPETLDAEDRMVKRLGRLRVETTNAADEVIVSIESDALRCLRLFRNSQGVWRRLALTDEHSWTLSPGTEGALEIGVGVLMPEARAAGERTVWPRAFTVVIATKSQQGERLRVPFRVAPFIIPSALEPVDELMIVSQPVTEDSVDSLAAFATRTGVKLVAYEVDENSDQWMQDTIEPGVFTFPTELDIRQARACLTGLRKGASPLAASLDNRVTGWLRRQGVVTVAPGTPRKKTRWTDGYGNIEATPPHTDRKGRRFPFGRVITGKQRELTMHSGVLSFLEAQGAQWPPIVVDTSWLTVGHVDEVVNFVPAKTKAGFKVLLPSPKSAREILQALVAKGWEEAPVFEGTDNEMTLGDLEMTIAHTAENLAIDEAVGRVREQLKRELNLEDSDFVMVPALFDEGLAVIPNPVNSVVVNGHLLVPEPLGPRHNDRDEFEQAIRSALFECDVRVVFVDSWNAYHSSGGGIHCGTNTVRRLRQPEWWKNPGTANPDPDLNHHPDLRRALSR